LARRVEVARTNIKRKKDEIENKKSKLVEYNRVINGLKDTLKNIDGQTLNTEDRLNKLKDMIEVKQISC
jgi:septal ring factor EnvC (AmiA/AmiB activator)